MAKHPPQAAPAPSVRVRLLLAGAALLLFALLAIGVRWGTTQSIDTRVMGIVRDAGGLPLRRWVIGLTDLGSAPVLLGIAAAASLWLVWRRQPGRAARLALILLGGRLAIELVKDLVARARPPLAEQAVAVHSWSFPSAHSANSTITYCTLALLLSRGAAPARRRSLLGLAALAALAVGASRVWLGVHWPVDVLAGWLFGIFWVTLASTVAPGSPARGVA